MHRLMFAVAMTAALMLTVGAASAGAHKKKIERRTTLEFQDLPGSSGDRLSGQVGIGAPPEDVALPPGDEVADPFLVHKAGKANCLSGQKVIVRHTPTHAGGGEAGPTTVVATTVTDASGFWETTAYEASGANRLLFDNFKVEIAKRRMKPKNKRHKHVCKGAFASRTPFSY